MTKPAPAPMKFLGMLAASAAALVFSAGADAQITVTSATLPAAGDTLRLARDNSPGPCVFATAPGVGQTWDFTCLKTNATQEIVYRPASEGSVVVPGAQFFAVTAPSISQNGPLPPTSLVEEYYDVTSTGLRVLATYGKGYQLASDTLFRWRTPSVLLPWEVRSAPLNYFDIRAQSASSFAEFDPSALSPSFLAALGFTPLAFRYRIEVNDLAVVDASGTLSIPGGTYDVLRERRTRYTQTALDALFPTLGWMPVDDEARAAGHPFLRPDTLTTYSFYSNEAKEPIAVFGERESLDYGVVALPATFKLIAAVPEPGTYVLLAAGLAAVGFAARRRSAKA